jgi:hypothetical protein
MKFLLSFLSLISLAYASATAQTNVLTERNVLSSNFLSQSTYALNVATVWDASDRPAGALSEGMLIFQNVNPYVANFSVSLYADVNKRDLYMNTGQYGNAGANWQGWLKFLNSGNFSSYALPIGGGTLNGNLGIGATVPSGYKLAVAGSAIAESVTVKLQGQWGDYVFKPAYKLRPLSNVENFINQNQHLPEIPSAGDIKKSGIDLGQMVKLQMKKIEELTLYLIEKDKTDKLQQKEIAAMRAGNFKLQKQLNQLRKQIAKP